MSGSVAIGVDTHRDSHVAVAFDRCGGSLGRIEVAADANGYLQLWQWAQELGEPVFAVEGTGSYGAGLGRFLAGVGCEVYECERPRRRVAQLDREIDELDQELHTITTQLLPELLAECGVGPICADQLVVSSGDPTRMTSEASFAALARHQPRTSICVIRQLARYFYRQLQTIPTLDLTP